MLNPRILIIFSDIPDADSMLDMMLEALSKAGRPYSLRFAVPGRFAPALEATELPKGTLNPGDMKFYTETDGLAGVLPIVADETHFLLLKGLYGFAERWETVLLARLGRITAQRAVLTTQIEGEGKAAQAYLPAFIGAFEGEKTQLGTGLALVCSPAPIKTLIIHPAFVFGKLDFLRHADTTFDTLPIAAYAADYTVYALDRAPVWPVGGLQPDAWLRKPGPEALPPTALLRFEQLAGISFARATATVRAMQGVFNVDDGYPQRLPPRLAMEHHANALLRRAGQPMPLVVTAFIDLPEAFHPPQSYMLRFSYLKALRHLPLTLYAGGEMERQLRAGFPNTLAYPDNSLLPRTLLADGITPMQLFRRNKLLLMQRTLRAYPSFSHIAWLDIDVLLHPICPNASLDFSKLMDNRIHLAWVGGEPDTSMMVVPRRHIKLLVREVQSVTQLDTDLKRSYAERELIRRLMDKFPDLFTLHPMPQKGLLFFTAVDAQLLSVPLAQALQGLPEPIRVPPVTPPPKERCPHD